MERTGNTIGNEGRRQHNPNDPSRGDRQHRQERLADAEIAEAGREGAEDAAERTKARPRTEKEPYGEDDVGAAEGIKPVTRRRIQDVDPESGG